MPTRDTQAVAEGGRPADQAEGVQCLRTEESAAVYTLIPGTYRFVAENGVGSHFLHLLERPTSCFAKMRPDPVFGGGTFLKGSALCGGLVLADTAGGLAADSGESMSATPPFAANEPSAPGKQLPDLAPAQWVWYPSERTLQNTFVLFRREVEVPARPRRAAGWIAADSRYLLEVNGQRIQWGPAPSDPRWSEADPVDLTAALQPGRNILGATVLFYGQGDGTWPIGKPGFLFWLQIEHADGRLETVVSDAAWRALLCRAWRPGQFKRWYLRALQEEFDARLYPYDWSKPEFPLTPDWLAAMPLQGSPNKPALSAGYYEYMLDVGGGPANTELRPRSIPLMRETLVPVNKLSESLWLEWIRPPQEYFEFRSPNAFQEIRRPSGVETAPGVWQAELDGVRGAALTFELVDQVVGWPYFTIEAPAGTVVELLVHEAHQVGGPALLNTHFDSWTRFICREGVNHFETFDFESLRWLQLHIHNATGTVTVRDVGVRRRVFPWPNEPQIRCGEPSLQRLFDASINTLHNCARNARGRHGPRAAAVQRRRCAPVARNTTGVRRNAVSGALPGNVQSGHDEGWLLPRHLAGLRPAWPDSWSGSLISLSGDRFSTTASSSISTAGTTSTTQAISTRCANPIRGCSGSPITCGASRGGTVSCRWKTSAFRPSGSITAPTSANGTSSANSTSTRPRQCSMRWRRFASHWEM